MKIIILIICFIGIFILFIANKDLPAGVVLCNDSKKTIQKIKFLQNGNLIFQYDEEIFQNEMIVVKLKKLTEEQGFSVKAYFKDGLVVDFVADVYMYHGDQYSLVLKQDGIEVYWTKDKLTIL